jgi:hypothetical protein
MINFSKNNYVVPAGTGDNFTITFNSLSTTFSNYFTESCIAAEEIYNLKQGKLYMLYSGGLDSEYALSVFLHLKMDVTPVIINLHPNYNNFDTVYAIDFCNKNHLKPLIVNLDFDKFVKSGKFLEVSKICKSELYQMAATAYIAGTIDGTIILGGGEPYIQLKANNEWNVEIYQYDYAIENYFLENNIHGVPQFNSYTPEMLMSFLSDNRIIELVNNIVPGKLGSNSSKFMIYNRHSNFNLVERPKYHGYEKIEKSKIFQHDDFQELKTIGKTWNGIYSKNYFEFMKTYSSKTT